MKHCLMTLCILITCFSAGCSRTSYTIGSGENGAMIVGTDITENQIDKFYYTIENINYDAYYLRYLFYVEDGKHMFFFEERERKNNYGPTTKEDTIAEAEFELSDDEWSEFLGIVEGGEIRAREDDPEGV